MSPNDAADQPTSTTSGDEAEVKSVEFSEQTAAEAAADAANLDLILDITVPVTVRLGETEMTIDKVLAFAVGSVIELDRLASDPIDVLVGDKLIARGEVVLVDENFGIRISSIVDRAERLSSATAAKAAETTENANEEEQE